MKFWLRKKEDTPAPIILSVLPDIFEYQVPFLYRKTPALLFGIPALIVFLILLFSCATDLLIPANARWSGLFIGIPPLIVSIILWLKAEPGEFLRADHNGIGYRKGFNVRYQVNWENIQRGIIRQEIDAKGYITFKSVSLRGPRGDLLFAWAYRTDKRMPPETEITFIEYIHSKLPEESIRFE
jgi:hypothetical protein